VNAFGYGPEHIRASIASGAEKTRQSEAREYYKAARAAGTLPVEEKKQKKTS
jgi:acyl-CoA oxidase